MNWLRDLLLVLFPYRSHLEQEIEYLRQQLSQKQRRVDELQEKLVELLKPPAKIQFERKPDGKLVPIQPRGWDAVRAMRRLSPEPGPDEPAKEQVNGL